jgi:hypothetical protein
VRARGRRPSRGPRRVTAWACEGMTTSLRGPHASESGRGETVLRSTAGRTGRPRGGNPAAGGLGDDSPLVARFLGNG